MNVRINLVFMGTFTYPRGMAGTRRIQNVINALKEDPDISTRVILQRQSSKDNALSGMHEGTPYETVMGDLLRAGMFIKLPLLYYKTCCALKRVYRPDHKNLIYFYGPLFIDSIMPLYHAKMLGYQIVFDVIEDFGLSGEISHSVFQIIKGKITSRFTLSIKDLSAGIIVISSYLEKQSRLLTKGRVPVHYMPISVNMRCFPEKQKINKPDVSLFYAGSFGKKDGLPVLLDAFDSLAAKYKNIRLILTGRGDHEAMKEFFFRVERSPYKERIDYRGYLKDQEYYALLNEADILCMTRVDIAFAQAGFPFKLGEYLATGKPVIASRVSDVEQYLANKHNAVLVQAGASKEICDAVEFLINQPEEAAALGKRGRQTAEEHFDHRTQGKAFIRFLENI